MAHHIPPPGPALALAQCRHAFSQLSRFKQSAAAAAAGPLQQGVHQGSVCVRAVSIGHDRLLWTERLDHQEPGGLRHIVLQLCALVGGCCASPKQGCSPCQHEAHGHAGLYHYAEWVLCQRHLAGLCCMPGVQPRLLQMPVLDCMAGQSHVCIIISPASCLAHGSASACCAG